MNEASVQIELLSELSDADAAELETLLGQLSTAAFDRSRIAAMFDHDGIELFVARNGRRIVGMATLITVPLPTGWRGHVEDVVVDATMRGRGVARLLLERLTSLASERGLRTLDLTPAPRGSHRCGCTRLSVSSEGTRTCCASHLSRQARPSRTEGSACGQESIFNSRRRQVHEDGSAPSMGD